MLILEFEKIGLESGRKKKFYVLERKSYDGIMIKITIIIIIIVIIIIMLGIPGVITQFFRISLNLCHQLRIPSLNADLPSFPSPSLITGYSL